MRFFNKSWVRKICDSLYRESGYPVLIGDRDGFIRAAGGTIEIDYCHPAAQKVVAENLEQLVVDDHPQTVSGEKGVFVPIRHQGEIIGSLGVLGKPDEVRPLASTIVRIMEIWLENDAVAKTGIDQLTLLNNINDGYYEVDLEGNMTFFNHAGCEILGYPEHELMGKNYREYTDEENAKKLFKHFNRVFYTGEPIKEMDVEYIRKDGSRRFVEISISLNKKPNGDIVGFRGIARDITERKRADETIQHMAYHDDLTGLPNRRMLQDKLKYELEEARRKNHRLAVLFLDLDRFKIINDSLGHAFGDLVLNAVSRRLVHSLNNRGIVGRMGGDEFTVILPGIRNVNEVVTLARKIVEEMNKPLIIQGQEFHITCSIGISLYPEDGLNVENLMMRADTAMYRAKEQGRNNYKFYRTDKDAWASRRLELETQLRKALQQEEFILFYQPQVDMHGQIRGMEALVRWEHPVWGIISPQKFIPLAEETGLIVQLDEWVLKTACRQNKEWQEQGFPPIPVSVNLSMRQFQQKNLVDHISAILTDVNLDAKFLELELTESMVMNNSEETLTTLRNLKKMGIQISLDDFGTGYSSLSHLKYFPIDALKIDQSFIRNITNHPDDMAIVQAIIRLAHSLKLKVVAEGVEHEKQSQLLLKWGCHLRQGYLFSPPVPAEQLQKLFVKV